MGRIRLILQHDRDQRHIAIRQLAQIVMRALDDLAKFFLITCRRVAMPGQVQAQRRQPRRIVRQKLAIIAVGLLGVAGATRWNEIAQAMFA